MARKINIAFLWHMHQPPYEDASTGTFLLPWVYLHATKDYYDMAALLERHPRMKANFNLTPCLLEQLQQYQNGTVKDQTLELLMRDAERMSEKEKASVLRLCFFGCPETLINRFPRYKQLYDFFRAQGSIQDALDSLEIEHFRDLSCLFLLAWCGQTLQKDPAIKEITSKRKRFNEDDKRVLLEKGKELIRGIVPLYKKLHLAKKIEVSTSPFYHPLLPLLYSNSQAIEANPYCQLPSARFSAPEEVERQITIGLSYFEKIFGFRPEGMWPPEGAVSQAVIEILKNRVHWIATDEEILRKSLGGEISKEERFMPFRHNGLVLFFRDRVLSDFIGFVYSRWPNEKSVEHFILQAKARADEARDESALLLIAMDGENAWEYYPDGGFPFLDALYTAIENADFLEPVTLSEYLQRFAVTEELEHVATGSWINGNLDTWIGDPVKNKAWEYLAHAYQVVRDVAHVECGIHGHDEQAGTYKPCYLLRAEASDWFWWFGKGHASQYKKEFDYLFRQNLKAVYQKASLPPPQYLDRPLEGNGIEAVGSRPTAYISPEITGRRDSFYKWTGAGKCEFQHGSVHRLEPILACVHYGFDRENIYIRADGFRALSEFLNGDSWFKVVFIKPIEKTFRIASCGDSCVVQDNKGQAVSTAQAKVFDVLEMKIPFTEIDINLKEQHRFTVEFYIVLGKGALELERFPWDSVISFEAVTRDFDLENWFV